MRRAILTFTAFYAGSLVLSELAGTLRSLFDPTTSPGTFLVTAIGCFFARLATAPSLVLEALAVLRSQNTCSSADPLFVQIGAIGWGVAAASLISVPKNRPSPEPESDDA